MIPPLKEKVLSITDLRKHFGDLTAVDGISFDEHVDDLARIAPERRFSSRKPQVSNLRHRCGDFIYLLKSEVTRMIQLFVIEAGLAERVTTRCHK